MRIGIVGGTGRLGSALAVRWARAGHAILLGSRSADKARARAGEIASRHGVALEGRDDERAASDAEVAVVAVPYEGHGEAVRAVAASFRGRFVIDATVPLRPPNVAVVRLPAGGAAALEAQAILGAKTPVVAALHHVSAAHLADPAAVVRCDVLVASDDATALRDAQALVGDLGLRALDAGPLANAVALEALTPVLIHLNKTYGSRGAGVTFTDLPAGR